MPTMCLRGRQMFVDHKPIVAVQARLFCYLEQLLLTGIAAAVAAAASVASAVILLLFLLLTVT